MIFTGSPSSVKPCATPQANEAPTQLRVAAETESAFEDVKALTEWSSRSRPFVQVAAERVEDGADVLEPLSELSADDGGQPELGADLHATGHYLMGGRTLRK